MSRLIDADTLKKDWRMGSVCETCVQDTRQCCNDYCFSRMDVCEMIDDAPTVDGWISVKDRLPEVGKVVLAFGTRSATTGMFQGVGTRNDLWWWKGHTIKHVSHWMPLPKPPKEGEAE